MTPGLQSIATSFAALVNSLQLYCWDMLDDITFYFLQEPVTISDGFQNHIISYNISYSDSATGNICSQTTTIPAVTCYNRICIDLFDISSSFCHPSTNITISVLATSMLGPGQSSDPLTICK